MDDRLERLIKRFNTDIATNNDIDEFLDVHSYYDVYDLALVLSHLKSSNSILSKDPAVVKKVEDKFFSRLGKSKAQFNRESTLNSFTEEHVVDTRRFDVPFPM